MYKEITNCTVVNVLSIWRSIPLEKIAVGDTFSSLGIAHGLFTKYHLKDVGAGSEYSAHA